MLMIDRIKLGLLNQVPDMRKLKGCDPLGGQQLGEAGHKIMNVGDMREHVRRMDQISMTVAGSNFTRDLLTKERHNSWDALLSRDPGYIFRRFHTDNWHAKILEMLQGTAIITGHFGHERFFS